MHLFEIYAFVIDFEKKNQIFMYYDFIQKEKHRIYKSEMYSKVDFLPKLASILF